VPELAFFIGKGGVGKTTVSAAYAIQSALRKPAARTLLVSTDPAHSLSDVLQMKLGAAPARVPLKGRAKLLAWEMNSAALFGDFLGEHKQDILDIVDRGSLFTAEEIAPLLDTTLPGMSEIAALLAIRDAIQSGKYSSIVVDSAPFGHTLRLFSLPEQFVRLLNFLELAAGRDQVLAQHFGGKPAQIEKGTGFLADWRTKIEELHQAITRASLFLVTTAETFALNESVRCLRELRNSNPSLRVKAVVLNRVTGRRGNSSNSCSNCKKKAAGARAARVRLRKEYSSAKLYVGEDPGFPILGTKLLREFAEHVFSGKRLDGRSAPPKSKKPKFSMTAAKWPILSAPLSFVVGKGGVGKTTISAALGFCSRQTSAMPVEICSVDPAPSLDDIFQTPVGDRPKPVLGDRNFIASEMDSVALFKSWVAEIRNEIESATRGNYSGVHVDLSFERQLFSELLEIVPPGLDEVLAIFRITELFGGELVRGTSRRIIIDMAPTGHALELLHMPERILVWSRLLLKSLAAHRKLALAREAAVKIATLELHARELSKALKSSRQVAVFSVMLPEPLPDRETERLLDEMWNMGLSVKTIFVNRVIVPDKVGKCRRCRLAVEWQGTVLANLKRRYPENDIYAIRNFDTELAGRKGLRAITSELWRLN
jgi:arsenite-transporting ATPase